MSRPMLNHRCRLQRMMHELHELHELHESHELHEVREPRDGKARREETLQPVDFFRDALFLEK